MLELFHRRNITLHELVPRIPRLLHRGDVGLLLGRLVTFKVKVQQVVHFLIAGIVLAFGYLSRRNRHFGIWSFRGSRRYSGRNGNNRSFNRCFGRHGRSFRSRRGRRRSGSRRCRSRCRRGGHRRRSSHASDTSER
nr:MAG TPA: hypothetical protein [Caudoviricetes sp.]